MSHAILLVTDFSHAADLAAQRAVLLARQRGCELLLAHLAGSGPPDVAERLPRHAAMLARRHRLPVRLLGSLDLPGLRHAAAAQAGLLVMGWPPPAVGRWPWSGAVFATRLLWRLECPLLVVRRPAHNTYTRLLVALGAAPAPATRLLRVAAEIAPDAELELFHAIDTRRETHLLGAGASR
jgi:nucleotide-binding universal stress UspA family protein